jgi:hypothetical protein
MEKRGQAHERQHNGSRTNLSPHSRATFRAHFWMAKTPGLKPPTPQGLRRGQVIRLYQTLLD